MKKIFVPITVLACFTVLKAYAETSSAGSSQPSAAPNENVVLQAQSPSPQKQEVDRKTEGRIWNWQTIIALLSALASASSAIYARNSVKTNRENTKLSTNFMQISQAEALIRDHPNILSLHGINVEMIDQIGIKPTELVYLIHSFSAGDLYYRVGGPGPLTQYRVNLLKDSRVREVWNKVIKNRFIDDGFFANAIDEHIKLHPLPG